MFCDIDKINALRKSNPSIDSFIKQSETIIDDYLKKERYKNEHLPKERPKNPFKRFVMTYFPKNTSYKGGGHYSITVTIPYVTLSKEEKREVLSYLSYKYFEEENFSYLIAYFKAKPSKDKTCFFLTTHYIDIINSEGLVNKIKKEKKSS